MVPASARASAEQEPGRRAALIVGNHLYRSVPALKNAVNDSDAVAAALRQLGFEVTSASDVDLATFKSTIDAFEKSAEDATSVVFYFSGHGFQLNGVNYLVPVDATLRARAGIEAETVRLDAVIARLQRPDRQTLVFLDACRNNPLPEAMRSEGGQGLAQIETGAGTFVAFATQPGNVALDGTGEHSYFTNALLQNVGTPGISISDMMIRVRNSVETATLGQQTPWDQSSLRSQFYFKPQEEESAALTDEDRELLMSLDPALRKKFESRFGIRIDEAFAPGDESADGQADSGGDDAASNDTDAPIVPNIVIKDDAGDAEAAHADKEEPGKAPEIAALAPQASAPAAPSLIIMDPEEPARAETGAAEAEAPPAADAGSEIATAQPGPPIPTARPDDTVIASAEPAGDEPPAPETQTASAPVLAAPSPAAATPSEAPPVVIARAEPEPANSEPASPEPASPEPASPGLAAPEPASPAPAVVPPSAAPVKQATASAAASSSAEIAVASPAQPESAMAAPGEPIRIAPRRTAESAAPAASAETVVASAGSADPLRPAAREVERMVGQEVAPDVVAGDAVPAARPVEAPPAAALEPPKPPVADAAALAPVVAEAPGRPAVEPSKPAEPESSLQVASVEPAPDRAATANRPEIGVPENPIPQPDAEAGQTGEQRRETARAIQGELTRLGCYRSAIDGSWGQSSAKGLLRYFATKKEAPDALEPTPELLARLSDEPNVVCQRTETVTPDKPRTQKRTVERTEKPARQNAASRPPKTQKVAREERSSGGGGGGGGGGKKIKKITGLGGF